MKSTKRCAKWCGRGCTEAEYRKARASGDRLAARLGPAWRSRVWENLGWHFSAVSGCGRFKVHPSLKSGHFLAFLGRAGCSGGIWTAYGRTPRGAVVAVLKAAMRDLRPYKNVALPSMRGALR